MRASNILKTMLAAATLASIGSSVEAAVLTMDVSPAPVTLGDDVTITLTVEPDPGLLIASFDTSFSVPNGLSFSSIGTADFVTVIDPADPFAILNPPFGSGDFAISLIPLSFLAATSSIDLVFQTMAVGTFDVSFDGTVFQNVDFITPAADAQVGGTAAITVTGSSIPVPAPATALTTITGLVAFGVFRRRRTA